MVVARTTSECLVCLDPMLGLVETPILSLPGYHATGSVRVPPSQSAPSSGRFSGSFAYFNPINYLDTVRNVA